MGAIVVIIGRDDAGVESNRYKFQNLIATPLHNFFALEDSGQ